MTYVIMNSFHWIGFHLMNHWLDRGEDVVGVDSHMNHQKEFLKMYVGRNSSFHHVDSLKEVKEEEKMTLIQIGIDDTELSTPLSFTSHWVIQTGKISNSKASVIYNPEVFGPWMPKPIKPTNEEALYIDDFINGVSEVIEHDVQQNVIEVKPAALQHQSNQKQHTLYVTETVSQGEGWQRVLTHQKKFPSYYQI